MLGRVDVHVTLVEPINVREESLGEIERIMRDAAAATPGPLTLTFGPALSFHPESPVLYLAVDGDLDELAALRAAMRVGPFAREAAWPFVPHVTIGTDLSEERLDAGVGRWPSSRRRCRSLMCRSCRSSGIRTRCAGGDRSRTPHSEVARCQAGVASSSK